MINSSSISSRHKNSGSGCALDLAPQTTTTTLIVSNEEMEDIMKMLSILKILVY